MVTSAQTTLLPPQAVLLWGSVSSSNIGTACTSLKAGTTTVTFNVTGDNWVAGAQPYATTITVSCKIHVQKMLQTSLMLSAAVQLINSTNCGKASDNSGAQLTVQDPAGRYLLVCSPLVAQEASL